MESVHFVNPAHDEKQAMNWLKQYFKDSEMSLKTVCQLLKSCLISLYHVSKIL